MSSVSIGTEQLPREEGGTRNVSTMEIILTKRGQAQESSEVEKEPQVDKDTGKETEEANQGKNSNEE